MRGLKQDRETTFQHGKGSHPTWVRGLKLLLCPTIPEHIVAPYVGAWIETQHSDIPHKVHAVAPYVGAWIETTFVECYHPTTRVAPYVGAWIETSRMPRSRLKGRSHPTWVRGLKQR